MGLLAMPRQEEANLHYILNNSVNYIDNLCYAGKLATTAGEQGVHGRRDGETDQAWCLLQATYS